MTINRYFDEENLKFRRFQRKMFQHPLKDDTIIKRNFITKDTLYHLIILNEKWGIQFGGRCFSANRLTILQWLNS